ncbi:MAG: cation diffusion facilitator family transporter [gamma proteobacterium symbiont of Bathyaustriella thionipta]|nr:cation diffusion facilitator family transporter [gamma proteobacterium symbiont of Bathyaustriella thionipta]MCU7950001.1 cation diffusion facilitator family transporter [gamma proteobacterium symbiont of Bathyaustriella thionipta]MCU7952925.1 cation diffusion facilitator family transporter [gamma proteobacterium symbiont of Bathyaustriella thionipta]MCU7956587.1 cation diffusion facilitator family transporter [gamma proteobacterium symbiont of Bathyaustriella thionipta]MCU7968068.1 cation d
MSSEDNTLNERYQITTRVTIVGAVVNLVLAILKIIIGFIGHSHALIVDGIHSFSDLLSDGLVVLAAKKGNQSPDDDHPYGHARIETAFAAVLGGVLIAVGIGIVIDALDRLTSGNIITPESMTIWVALLSVLSKEVLYRYTLLYADRLNSPILKANAWHHRSDAISSIVVLVGIAGSMSGIPYLDAAAAVIVSMMIAKIGWEIAKESIEELVDKGLDPEKVQSISHHITEIPGVSQMHMLRTRQMGAEALLDVHIEVSPQLSVSEGHRISDEVSAQLTNDFPDITQVLVHIDPENDEANSSCSHLPLRNELLIELEKNWSVIKQAELIEDVVLHYLDGKVQVQIIMPLSILSTHTAADTLAQQFSASVENLNYIESLELLYR